MGNISQQNLLRPDERFQPLCHVIEVQSETLEFVRLGTEIFTEYLDAGTQIAFCELTCRFA